MFKEPFSPLNTFIYGFLLCGIFLVQTFWAHWRTKREHKTYKIEQERFRSMLSTKMELEAKMLQQIKEDCSRLEKENENLRILNARLNDRPDNKMQREMEILARSEKQMYINAPGFAPAWENAKSLALAQLENEEKGKSFPQKIIRMLTGSSSVGNNVALPESAAAAKNGEATANAA